ncbi:MAG TPA: helix-turn-helix domain-containing protein [Pseudonocardia sp.]|jgi:transcriptional regulator with XRE-family HTH domain|nr:helix-turn-helix domain-containing protein [Pseudonocardia sp.]
MTRVGRRTVSPRPRVPRIGLGAGRIEPDRARFRQVPELLQYLCDYRGLTQAELADRRGVRREQVSRWMNGTAEPNLARLRTAMASLGLALVIALEPTPAVFDAMLARPTDLDQLLELDPPLVIRSGPVSAILRDGAERPASRLVRPEHARLADAELAVVTLAALRAEDSTDEASLGPAARELTGRFTACGGRAE